MNGLLHEIYIQERLFDKRTESNQDYEHTGDLFNSSARSVLFMNTTELFPVGSQTSDYKTKFITLRHFSLASLLTAVHQDCFDTFRNQPDCYNLVNKCVILVRIYQIHRDSKIWLGILYNVCVNLSSRILLKICKVKKMTIFSECFLWPPYSFSSISLERLELRASNFLTFSFYLLAVRK